MSYLEMEPADETNRRADKTVHFKIMGSPKPVEEYDISLYRQDAEFKAQCEINGDVLICTFAIQPNRPERFGY